MSTSNVSFASNPTKMPPGINEITNHQIRLEIALESGLERINVAGIIKELMKRANSTPEVVTVKFADIHGDPVTTQTLPKGQAFATRMAVEKVETGRTKKVVLGLYMQSTATMQVIKNAIGFPWLRQNQIYIRHQRMSFQHGTDLFLIGYLVKEHPTFANLEILDSEISGKWFDPAPIDDDDDPDTEQSTNYEARIKAMQEEGLIRNGQLTIPISVERSFVKVTAPGKNAFDTQILSVYVPRKNHGAATFLNDHLILAKGDLSIVPFSVSKSDPNQFYQQMKHHAKFLHEHRNIPIVSVPTREYYAEAIDLNSKTTTLQYLLAGNPNIHRFHYVREQRKLNVSVTASDYADVCKWLDLHLGKFAYAPQRLNARPPSKSTKASNNDGVASRASTTTGKYADAFTTSTTDSSSFDPSTIATGRTRLSAWTRGPPTELIFEPSDAVEFPPIASPTVTRTTPLPVNDQPTHRSNDPRQGYGGSIPAGSFGYGSNRNTSATNKTTANSIDTNTIEELIANAVAASEARTHQQLADIVERQSNLDKEITSLRAEIASQTTQIIDGTIKALSGANSPFLNRTDAVEIKQQHHDTQTHIRNIQQTLNRFMQHVTSTILPATRPLAAPNEEFEDIDIASPPRKISRPPTTQPESPFPANPTTATHDSMDWRGGEEE
jgi:hypothetical protein